MNLIVILILSVAFFGNFDNTITKAETEEIAPQDQTHSISTSPINQKNNLPEVIQKNKNTAELKIELVSEDDNEEEKKTEPKPVVVEIKKPQPKKVDKEETTLPDWLSGKKKKAEAKPIVVEEKKAEPKPVVVEEKKAEPKPVVVEEKKAEAKPIVVEEKKAEAKPIVVEEKKAEPKPINQLKVSKNTNASLIATQGFYHSTRTNRYFNNGKTPIALRMATNTKELQSVTVSLNDEEYIPYTGMIKLENEGLNHLNFRAVDQSGKEKSIQDFNIYVDTTSPEVTSFWHETNSPEAQPPIVSGNSLLSINAQDALSGLSKIMVEEGGIKKIYNEPIKFPDGKHTIQYYAVDHVGNQSEPITLEFIVDSNPPSTKFHINGAATKSSNITYIAPSAEIVLEVNESPAGLDHIEYKINGGSNITYHSPIHMLGSKMEIKYHSIDKAGNIEELNTLQLSLDSTPPVIKLGPHGQYTLKGNKILAETGFYIYLDAKDTESGIQDIFITLNGKTFEKTNEKNIIFDKPGEYHFSSRATDQVGNIKESNSYVVVVGDEGPKALQADN